MSEKNVVDETLASKSDNPAVLKNDSVNAKRERTVDDTLNVTAGSGGSAHRNTSTLVPGYEEERLKERKILTLRDLLYIFFKHLQSITIVTAICFLTAAIYSFTATPLYKADTKILVKLGREKLSDLNEYSSNINILYQERNQNVNNELEIFKGRELSRMVYEDLKEKFPEEENKGEKSSKLWSPLNAIKQRLFAPKLSHEDETILFLQNSLRVEFLAETDILKLTFSSKDPEFAAIAANAYADAFIRLRTKIYETKKSHNFYIDQIELYKKMVDDLVEKEKSFSRKWHISEVAKEMVLVLQNKGNLEAEYLQVQQDYERIRALLVGVKEMYDTPGSWIETPKMSENEMVDRQGYLQDLDRQYFTLTLERSRLIGQFTEKSREIRRIDASIAQLRTQKYLSLVNVLGLNRDVITPKLDSYANELAEKNARIDELIEADYVLSQLKLEKDVAIDSFLNYTKKAEDLRIYDDLDKKKINSLSIINTAISPLQSYFPKTGLILLTATFFGIFLSFGLSAVKEFFTHVFRDGQDIERILGVPLLMSVSNQVKRREFQRVLGNEAGSIPLTSGGDEQPAAALPLPHLHDQFLSLVLGRLNSNDGLGTSIGVSSCRQGEGVSTLVHNLALALAENTDRRILLVDGNSRIPKLSALYNGGWKSSGLMDVLEGDKDLEDVLQKESADNPVNFIPTGKKTKHPIVHFSDSSFERFLRKAREQFDVVLIDTPTLTIAPETSIIARKLDSFILVIEAETTRWEVATHYKDQLAETGVRFTGAILNKKKMFIPRFIYRILLAD